MSNYKKWIWFHIVRRWKEVSSVKSPELRLILLEGKENDGAPVHTVLPLPAHQSLSHSRWWVTKWELGLEPSLTGLWHAAVCLLSSICSVLERGFPVLLCAVASDSTLVYQRLTDGLVTPEPPVGPFQDLDRRQHRKRRQHSFQQHSEKMRGKRWRSCFLPDGLLAAINVCFEM